MGRPSPSQFLQQEDLRGRLYDEFDKQYGHLAITNFPEYIKQLDNFEKGLPQRLLELTKEEKLK